MLKTPRSLAVIFVLAGCTRTAPPEKATAGAPADLGPTEICNPGPPKDVIARAAKEKESGVACAAIVAAAAEGKLVVGPALVASRVESERGPLLAAIRDPARNAVECRAIAADDDAPCAVLSDGDERDHCRLERAFFHAARTPADPAWRFTDAFHAYCRKALGAACDAWRAALRGSDPTRCPKDATGGDCVAEATADPTRCSDGECRSRVQRIQLVGAGGLARLAEGGGLSDRWLAAAALGKSDGCRPALAALDQACRSAIRPPRPDGGQR